MSVRLFCVEGNYEAVEAALKSLKGIDSVASLPTKKGRNVFAKFASDDAAAAALEVLKDNDKVVIPAEKKAGDKAAPSVVGSTGKKKVNVAGDFFRYDPYSGPRQPAPSNAGATEPGSSTGNKQQNSGRGRSRGGASAPGRGCRGGRGSGRGGFQSRPRIPMIQGHVAVLDNVPVNATNAQIASSFDGCGGTIYDINRLENMAMVYFSSADAVQEAIVKMNGKKLGQNIVTVSSGGTVRVPAPVAPPQHPDGYEPMAPLQHIPASRHMPSQ